MSIETKVINANPLHESLRLIQFLLSAEFGLDELDT